MMLVLSVPEIPWFYARRNGSNWHALCFKYSSNATLFKWVDGRWGLCGRYPWKKKSCIIGML